MLTIGSKFTSKISNALAQNKFLSTGSAKDIVSKMFAHAQVGLCGENSEDIDVHDDRFYARFLRAGSLGLGESYMEGWWDCEKLDRMCVKLHRAKLQEMFKVNPAFLYHKTRAHIANQGTRRTARHNIRHHYDIGNNLYKVMLDPLMLYSCGYWSNAKTLAASQEAKLDLICQKLGLEPGMKILDIGCGWGGLLKYAAERYGITGVGVSISEEQIKLGRERCKGLPVDLRLQDYRDINETFDRVVSVGMFEHVGHKNHREYMEVVNRTLDTGGISLLHTIGRPKTTASGNNIFISKYIFPNTTVPSVRHIGDAIDGLFHVEDWEAFGHYYDPTLLAWHQNFQEGWPSLSSNYDERFRRMWSFYLMSSAAAFRVRVLDLWHIVLTKVGTAGGYQRPLSPR